MEMNVEGGDVYHVIPVLDAPSQEKQEDERLVLPVLHLEDANGRPKRTEEIRKTREEII